MTERKKIFVAHANDEEDKVIFGNLYLHLKTIKDLDILHQESVLAGAESTEVFKMIDNADAHVHLLSADFLATDTTRQVLEKSVKMKKTRFFIMGRHCDIQDYEISDKEIFPDADKSIADYKDDDYIYKQFNQKIRSEVLGVTNNKVSFNIRYLFIGLSFLSLIFGAFCNWYLYQNLVNESIYYIIVSVLSMLIAGIALLPVLFPSSIHTQK